MSEYNQTILSNQQSNSRFVVALLVSLLAHLFLILAFHVDKNIPKAKEIEITLLKKPQTQIVSPSDLPESTPLETRKLSDKDTRAETEKIQRGDSPKKPSAIERKQPTSQPANQPQKQQLLSNAKNPLPTELKLRDDQLLGKFAREVASPTNQEKKSTPDSQRQKEFQQSEPFQRSEGSIFRQGNPDLLPDIKDGDLTLLNAKADKHAVFVRRVALQVFGLLRSLSWQELNRSQINMLQNHTIIEAIMSPTGKLLSVKLESPSGSAAFDSIVKKAVAEGTIDQNPPSSAQAADGNIHFIFYSKSWSRISGDSLREQRWIMLGTGLL